MISRNAVRFDKRDYEYLSRESLWSAEDAIILAANVEMELSRGFQQELWVADLEDSCRKFYRLAYEWCEGRQLIPYGKAGRKEAPLGPEEWRCLKSVFNENDEFVEQHYSLNLGTVYFHKDDFLACLKEAALTLGDDLWAAVKPKLPAKLRPEQETRLICQGIAIALWDANPEMTSTDMAKNHLILKEGGGSVYTEKTRYVWVSDVDPRPEEKKTGPKRQQ